MTPLPIKNVPLLSWCLLVALRIGRSASDLQQHVFIMRWLTRGQKRKLFPRPVAADILWLQEWGKHYGLSARLDGKVEYIWFVTSGQMVQQSTLFRFTYMIDALRTMGWKAMLLSAKEWAAA